MVSKLPISKEQFEGALFDFSVKFCRNLSNQEIGANPLGWIEAGSTPVSLTLAHRRPTLYHAGCLGVSLTDNLSRWELTSQNRQLALNQPNNVKSPCESYSAMSIAQIPVPVPMSRTDLIASLGIGAMYKAP